MPSWAKITRSAVNASANVPSASATAPRRRTGSETNAPEAAPTSAASTTAQNQLS